jgi:hypothetical protein
VALSEEQIKDLIRKSSDNDIQNDLKQRDYTYTQRSEVRFLDGHGALQKTETETSEVMVLYGEQVERKIAKNDQPLSDKGAYSGGHFGARMQRACVFASNGGSSQAKCESTRNPC